MIRSMTGYGKAVSEKDGKTVTVEVKSLNSKQLDLNLRIPSLLRDKEYEIRQLMGRRVERGKVDLSVMIEFTEMNQQVSLNEPLAARYYELIKKLSSDLGDKDQALLPMVLKMPEVLKTEKTELSDEDVAMVFETMNRALDDFDKFRSREGDVLATELKGRCKAIDDLLAQVVELDKERLNGQREKLRRNVTELLGKTGFDENRFEQELIYYFEKLDISEEKTRLKTHLDYFEKTLNEDTNQGRKLGFISQELGREINTIGSKANYAPIQKNVVLMKDELEKIKEQLANIL